MLSHAAKEIGTGLGFGIHEALDQTAAVLGLLIIAFIFYLKSGYTESFAILAVPAILALSILFVAKRTYPRIPSVESIFEKPVLHIPILRRILCECNLQRLFPSAIDIMIHYEFNSTFL
jgi:hypothetical protein